MTGPGIRFIDFSFFEAARDALGVLARGEVD
jgi:hypothetical protein